MQTAQTVFPWVKRETYLKEWYKKNRRRKCAYSAEHHRKNKKARNKKKRDRYHQLRQEWLKQHGPCRGILPDGRICGSWDRLQVDHIDPSTKETEKIFTLGQQRREKELAKCQPLCVDCHADKTVIDRWTG